MEEKQIMAFRDEEGNKVEFEVFPFFLVLSDHPDKQFFPNLCNLIRIIFRM